MTKKTEVPDTETPDAGDQHAPSLEERLKRLEEIVRSLEAADLDMEGALTLFEEASNMYAEPKTHSVSPS